MQIMRSGFLSIAVLAVGGCDQESTSARDLDDYSTGDTIRTNLPPWRANLSLVAVRGIIWSEKIVADNWLDFSLLVKNVSKGDVFAVKKCNCGGYRFETEHSSGGLRGCGGEVASPEYDYVRLKPGEVMIFSPLLMFLEEPGEGKLRVIFHNNVKFEQQVAPKHEGIPLINHLEYDFGKIIVYHSNEARPATPPPRIVANTKTPVLLCWFVVHDDAGRHGYAAVDGRLGVVEPAGGGLFETLDAFRAAIRTSGVTNASIEPRYLGVIPAGWEIRGLTSEELRRLR